REAEANRAAEVERKRLVGDIAQSLDQQVKAVTDAVGTAANSLVDTARSMQAVAAQSRREADEASTASNMAAGHVAAVGQAAGQLDGAISEIGALMQES